MYEDFAHLYDALQTDVPYDKYAEYYEEAIERFGGKKGLCLDLGCGTGSLTLCMEERGFDMIGVDSSVEMLNAAREKGGSILYLNQDMRSFELYGTVGTVVSSLDCMNYVTDLDDLTKVFTLVNNYLDPKGLFIFDMNSEYKLKYVLGDNTYVSDGEDIFYSWQNSFDARSRICTFYLTFFEKAGDMYRRFDEEHYERAYSVEEVKGALEKAGLEFVGAFDDLSFDAANKESERIFYIARECMK
ncbi:MAG: class I SAM-dependent methyltransferase [Clostridia bacterium]|nr:class I SAM-dependent methyltransferase [Clostridia bacterium]